MSKITTCSSRWIDSPDGRPPSWVHRASDESWFARITLLPRCYRQVLQAIRQSERRRDHLVSAVADEKAEIDGAEALVEFAGQQNPLTPTADLMDVDNLESNSDKSLFSSPDDGSPALPSTPRDDVPTHLSFPQAALRLLSAPKEVIFFQKSSNHTSMT